MNRFILKRRTPAKAVWRESYTITVLFLSLFLIFSHSCFAVTPLTLKEGQLAPSFRLSSVSGSEIALSDFKNKAVLLFFWATWCPFCTGELPQLQKRYAEMKSKGIEVLAIDIAEPTEKVARFVSMKGVKFPVLLDKDNKVANSYGLVGVPTYVLIDSQGKIRFQGNSLPDDYTQFLN